MTYLGAVEARQQPLVGSAAVVNFSNLGQSVEVHVHSEVVGSAQAPDDDLVMQVTLAVHRHPGVARGARPHRRRHKLAGQRNRQLWKEEKEVSGWTSGGLERGNIPCAKMAGLYEVERWDILFGENAFFFDIAGQMTHRKRYLQETVEMLVFYT